MFRYGHRFGFGWPPFAFWFRAPGFFSRRTEYIHMLEDYKRELEVELKEVDRELEGLKKAD